MKLFIVLLVATIVDAQGYFSGENCQLHNGRTGVCKILHRCNYAKRLLRSNRVPQLCGFDNYGYVPVVCCPIKVKNQNLEDISHAKCLEYNTKKKDAESRFVVSVFGGKNARAGEFPHMALLGFGETEDKKWLCGGSLISESYILTAAHCLYHQEYGKVKFVRLGELDIKSTTETSDAQDFEVINTYQHPDFRANTHYNDIALLQLERNVEFTEDIKPACLYSNRTIPELLTITGWGQVSFLGDQSSHLLKADVNLIELSKCNAAYQSESKLPNGIVDDQQLCAGDPEGKDTCPGDSGGPIQVKMNEPSLELSYFSIVGITSFGRGCGIKNSVGVYTKVADYIPWIESIVWKN